MGSMIASLFLVVAVVIMVILLGILATVKSGFNQVIRGLEALDRQRGEP